jgi:hypothetical protein
MKRILIILGLALALAPCFSRAAVPKPSEPALDYLIIVDTSFSMVRLEDQVFQWIYSLVASGFDGHVQPNEMYSIWTFNEKVYNQFFSPKVWLPELNRLLASDSMRFLKMQRFEKQTFLYKVVAEVNQKLKTNPNLVVFLISDGKERLQGTPFDQPISAACVNVVPRLGRTKKPLLLTLVAREGQFIAWSLTVAGNPLNFPDLSFLAAQKNRPSESDLSKSLTPVVEVKAKGTPQAQAKSVEPPPSAPEAAKPAIAQTPIETKPAPIKAEMPSVPLAPPPAINPAETIAVTTSQTSSPPPPPVVAPAVAAETKPTPTPPPPGPLKAAAVDQKPVAIAPTPGVTKEPVLVPSVSVPPLDSVPKTEVAVSPAIQSPPPVPAEPVPKASTTVAVPPVKIEPKTEVAGSPAIQSPPPVPAESAPKASTTIAAPPVKIEPKTVVQERTDTPPTSPPEAKSDLKQTVEVKPVLASTPAKLEPKNVPETKPVPAVVVSTQPTIGSSGETKPSPGPSAIALPGEARTSSKGMIIAGFTFLLAAVGLLVLYSRSRRAPHPQSLISQSLDRKP